MTIPEACQLILQTANLGTDGPAVLTLDMGQPVAIRELAEQMIRLAGKRPGIDIAIEYTGLRPGEKLHETIFHPAERYTPSDSARVHQSEPRASDPAAVSRLLDRLDTLLANGGDAQGCRQYLREAVLDYRPEDEKIVPLAISARLQATR
jgi:FlaA1/EpsC-like NDP-sugar epimerase